MKWAALTCALLVTCIAGAAWIGLRDWEPSAAGRTQAVEANHAARRVLVALRGTSPCGGCRVQRLERAGGERWRLRLVVHHMPLCFVLTPAKFDTGGSGAGIRRTGCG
jgi:hypothetical protein